MNTTLTLEVLGRRDDFYHEIRSLVAFAALGDGWSLSRAKTSRLPSMAVAAALPATIW